MILLVKVYVVYPQAKNSLNCHFQANAVLSLRRKVSE